MDNDLALLERFDAYREWREHCCCSSATVREESVEIWTTKSTYILLSPPFTFIANWDETRGCPRREIDQSTNGVI